MRAHRGSFTVIIPEIIFPQFLIIHSFQVFADMFRTICQFGILRISHSESVIHFGLLLLNQGIEFIVLALFQVVQFVSNLFVHKSLPMLDILPVQFISNNSLLVSFLELALFAHLLLHFARLDVLSRVSEEIGRLPHQFLLHLFVFDFLLVVKCNSLV